jgi:hypothetical protein
MKHLALFPTLIVALALAAAAPAQAQPAFKIPFKFESGAKKLPAGEYVVTKTGDLQLTFKQAPSGKETVLAFTERLKPPQPAAAGEPTPTGPGPLLVFDEVGNFEPSYTEYFTVYVLAEVWLSPQEGYLVHTTKGAHKTKVVRAETR